MFLFNFFCSTGNISVFSKWSAHSIYLLTFPLLFNHSKSFGSLPLFFGYQYIRLDNQWFWHFTVLNFAKWLLSVTIIPIFQTSYLFLALPLKLLFSVGFRMRSVPQHRSTFFHVAGGTPLSGACVKMGDSWTLKQLLDGKWRREASSTWAQGHSEAKLKQRGMAVKPWDMSARPTATGNQVLI